MELTREQVLWWHTPYLRYRRQKYREYADAGEDWCRGGEYAFRNHPCYQWEGYGVSPIGSLPVLLWQEPSEYLAHHGWRLMEFSILNRYFNLDPGWRWGDGYDWNSDWYTDSEGHNRRHSAVEGPWDPTLTFLDKALWVYNDPMKVTAEGLTTTDDTERVVKLLQSVYSRFVIREDAQVASIWKEDGKLLCGWNELWPEDGRVYTKTHEALGVEWHGYEFKDSGWLWRIPN